MTLSIPFTLFPSSDNTAVTVNVEAKQGTDERKMEDYIPTLEKISQSQPEVKNYTISISDNIITSNIELFSKNYREKN
jgi:multidrug efflux pump subunit AcrB